LVQLKRSREGPGSGIPRDAIERCPLRGPGGSLLEVYETPDSQSDRTLIRDSRRGDVLQCHAGAVENDDLVVGLAAGFLAGDYLAELGVYVLPGGESSIESVMKLAD